MELNQNKNYEAQKCQGEKIGNRKAVNQKISENICKSKKEKKKSLCLELHNVS